MGVRAKLEKNWALNVRGTTFRSGAGRAEFGVMWVSVQSPIGALWAMGDGLVWGETNKKARIDLDAGPYLPLIDKIKRQAITERASTYSLAIFGRVTIAYFCKDYWLANIYGRYLISRTDPEPDPPPSMIMSPIEPKAASSAAPSSAVREYSGLVVHCA